MRLSKFAAALLTSCALTVGVVNAAPAAEKTGQAQDVRAQAEARASALVAKMTADEKVGQLVNVAPAIPRLGIPAYNWWTESLHGAMGAVPTTNFPEPIGLAATFDAPLIHSVAQVISEENRGLYALARRTGHLGRIGTGLDTWSPNINLFRDPRWGRGQETYGEDPYLSARLGVAYVTGMQGPNPDLPDIIATPKHYAVHSGPESTRHSANVPVSPHDLEDTYLPAFRAAIVEGQAGSIMCAYNSVDGQPACANELLLQNRLRGAWGFKGYVVSDCDAVKDIADNHKYVPDQAAAVAAALKLGVDNECNGDTLGDNGSVAVNRYKEALQRGLLTMTDVDRALVRLFSARLRNGDLAGLKTVSAPGLPLTTPEHTSLALKTAEKSIVLLKNNGLLPLDKPGVKIALIGPLADSTHVLRGNYSSIQSAPPVSVLAGIRQAMPGATVMHVPFGPSPTDGDSIPTSALRSPDGKPGLKAEYFNATYVPAPLANVTGSFWDRVKAEKARMAQFKFAAKPVVSRVETGIAARGNELKAVSDNHRVVWTGFLVPPESGTYRMGLTGYMGSVALDGKEVASLEHAQWGGMPKMTDIKLVKGKRYKIRVVTEAHGMSGIDLKWQRVSEHPDAELKAAAAKSDVIVAVVGLSSDLEGEEMPVKIEGFSGGDKTSLEIPADQREMLEQAKATGKPLVVVVMNGSPVALQWAKDNAAAIVETWYSGEEGGMAIANVLAGKTNPAGRLPLTFYASVKDLPPFDDYSMEGRTYRYFNGTPVYPFGYGLSYTTFTYGPVTVTPVNGAPEEGLKVTAEITNSGARDGDEVAELYLTPPAFEGAPRLALRGFQRLTLKTGERKTVSFTLSPRDLSFVTADGTRQIMPGQYTVDVGSGQPATNVAHGSATFTATKTVKLPE
jgi:beta-glucosidase